jgi:PliI/PliC-like inhibitor of I-type lysozyme
VAGLASSVAEIQGNSMKNKIITMIIMSIFIAGYSNNLSAGNQPKRLFTANYKNLLIRVEYGSSEPFSIGSYSLRVYNAGDKQFTFDNFISGFHASRDGTVEGLFVTDINMNKKPDIIIWFKSAGTGGYGNIACVEFDGQKLTKVILPELSKSQRSGYRRYDEFKVVNGKLYHSFPKYKPEDDYIKATGGQATFVYNHHDKKWLKVNPIKLITIKK